MAKKFDQKLDAEEKELLRSLDAGEWKPIANLAAERKRYAAIAHRTMEKLRKSRRVNIRLSPDDLRGMQVRALEEGIPYQTLMASVLHKYVTGRLIEKRS